MNEITELLAALKLAVDEAEGWYDECRGLDGPLDALEPCYALLKAHSSKTSQTPRGAIPNPHFAKPPYRAELFDQKSGLAGVMNVSGVNALTFPDKPGVVVTDYETAMKIAEAWNVQAQYKTMSAGVL